MATVPNPEHTAAFKLFKYPFRIQIPAAFISSIAENQALGTFTSGNVKVDRNAGQAMTPITSTIDKMVNFFERKIPIQFESTNDCVRIYDIILEHIKDHAYNVQTRSWAKEVPFEDLHRLDDFAGYVFLKARGRIAEREATTSAIGQLETRVASLIKPQVFGVEPNTVFERVAESTHKPMAEEIERTFQARFKTWR